MKCGVGIYSKRLAEALAKSIDVNVTVLTNVLAGETIEAKENDGVDVLAIISGWTIPGMVRIAKCVKSLNPDIVHIQYPTHGYAGILPMLLPLLMYLLGKPCVQTWHEPVIDVEGLLLTVGLRVLITPREKLLSMMSKLFQIALHKKEIVYIPSASLLPKITLSEENRLIVRNKYISDSECLISYYGFVAPLKGIEVLFEIVSKLNARLLMICDMQESDPYQKKLLDMIKSFGIEGRVTNVGFLPEYQLASMLSASDAVVLPFRDGAGAWNTTIGGAVAQGVFVLTTSYDINGYNEFSNVYYARPGNVDEMVMSIKKYYGKRSCFNKTETEWQNIAMEHIEIYKKLVMS
jgi:glycosyltransferase involved in cell wall biosynthesis